MTIEEKGGGGFMTYQYIYLQQVNYMYFTISNLRHIDVMVYAQFNILILIFSH